MVIVHLVAPAVFGGLERVVQTLARGQRDLGRDVHVVAVGALPRDVEPFLAPLAAAGVQTHALAMPGRAYARERAGITDLCRRLHPDVVHTHGYRPDVLHASVARRLGVPVVTTVHGFTGGGLKNRFYEWLQRRAFRRFDAVVAVSRPLAQRLARAGVPSGRIHAIPNAWRQTAPPLDRAAARQALEILPEDFVVGWVGRVSHEKGADVLLRALPDLNNLPVSISILGTGAEQSKLQARARALGIDGRVRWHGKVSEAGRLFRAFDVFVLSSRTEGTPMVLFEAMAAGVPVVATRVGGVPDVVSPAEALLVPSDDPERLAAAIADSYRDPVAARQRAAAAETRLAREFGVADWVGRYEAIYARVKHVFPVAA